MRKFCLFLGIVLLGMPMHAQSLQEVYAQGTKAYEEKDYAVFYESMRLADSLRPNHPTILYNLASSLALTDQKEQSIDALRRVLWMNASLPFHQDDDFATLQEEPAFKELRSEIEELNDEVRSGSTAFQVADASIHPEGIAYSERRSQYYLSSVHQNKVLVINSEGELETTIEQPDFMAMMGLQVDDERAELWVCSTPAPEMANYREGLQAEVLCIDLNTYQVIERYKAPKVGDWLGDLIVSSSGEVYVSNSSAENPTIYQVMKGKEELEVLIDARELVSIQGLALNTKETKLYFSDYRYGLFQYDLDTRQLLKLNSSIKNPLKGIDGLYYYEGDLIGIHNGLKPFRIVRYQLDASTNDIIGFRFLEKALPEMGEPTLGSIIGDELHYVVNSPWGAYTKEKNLDLELAKSPLVRKIRLN